MSGYNVMVLQAYYLSEGLPVPVFEYRFDPTRRWRFDMAWPERLVALEVEGGVWTGGRHSRGKGMMSDMEKYNTAVLAGWRVLRVVPAQTCMSETVAMLRRVLA